MAASMPRNDSRSALVGHCTGINFSRLSNCTTCILAPSTSLTPLRAANEITTWNFGETATLCVRTFFKASTHVLHNENISLRRTWVLARSNTTMALGSNSLSSPLSCRPINDCASSYKLNINKVPNLRNSAPAERPRENLAPRPLPCRAVRSQSAG